MFPVEASDAPETSGDASDGLRPPLRSVLPRFDVRVARSERLSVVEVAGELDILTAPKLITALDREHASAAMVLDLAKVTFMSSTGVALIVSLHRRLTRRGGHLALASLQPLVARLLEISGLAEALLIGDDVPAAIGLVAERL